MASARKWVVLVTCCIVHLMINTLNYGAGIFHPVLVATFSRDDQHRKTLISLIGSLYMCQTFLIGKLICKNLSSGFFLICFFLSIFLLQLNLCTLFHFWYKRKRKRPDSVKKFRAHVSTCCIDQSPVVLVFH